VVSVVVDTSALFALLDRRDAHHASAVAFWTDPDDEDLLLVLDLPLVFIPQ
jgi:hypothetical protein